jgi:flagellar biosynthesis protein FlhB
MAEQNGEKSQDATPHRRQQAREEGQVARSQDLASAVLLILGLLCLQMLGGGLLDYMGQMTREQLGGSATLAADVDFAVSEWNRTMISLVRCALPMLGLMMLAAVLVNLLQVGFLFQPKKVAPDIAHIDPLQGLQRIFSMSNMVRLVFGLFKLAVIGTVAFLSLYKDRDAILGMTAMAVPEAALFLVQTLFWTSMKVAIALLVLAILDYGFQRWKFEQDLRMTSQEVREEMKNMEGDPHIAARRKQVQRQLAQSRMSSAVPKADVVVTNPTELAVAIQYDPEEMAAPIVVAKGAGTVAQRIRKLALEHNVPIVEKKPLAQALYKEVEIGHPIPQDKYAAVAEVLAYVYQLQGKTIPTPPR